MDAIIEALPDEIIYEILMDLDPLSLRRVFQLRRFALIANDEYFWHQKIKHDYGEYPQLGGTWKDTWILLLKGVRFTYWFVNATNRVDGDASNEDLEYTIISDEKINYVRSIIDKSVKEVIEFLGKDGNRYRPIYISSNYEIKIRDQDFDVILRLDNLNMMTNQHLTYVGEILGEFMYINMDTDEQNEKIYYREEVDDFDEDFPFYNEYVRHLTIDGFHPKWSKINSSTMI